ncbi:MAG: sulfatase-like hydrolase/transferase, partial [Firmicutes bacterium]|nr:sulfatase-like hydrolase/transferase [Bacillota bacterium]
MRIRENSNGRPINVLLILADQHRSDCLGAYGNKDVYTPNIDSLAHDGMLFENCFCTSPLCTPSRYSMLTSLYAHQHRGWSNYATLSSGFSTFARALRKKGYSTKAVGKMHFAPTYLDVGFDELVLAEQNGPGRYEDDYHRYLKRKGLVDAIDLMDQVEEYRADAPAHYWESFGALESNLSDEDYSTTWIGEQAISAIEKWGETGNLLMVGFIKPHHPYDAPAEWNQMYDPDDLTVLPGWIESCLEQDLRKHPGTFPHTELTISKLRKVMAYYYASITQIDFHVGRMIKMLKEKNMYDNTMIIYTSDHGEYLGFHHLLVKKNYMYDPLVKIPLIIKYPDQQLAGTRSEALVTNLDIAPTILHQAGCPSDELMQGKDLLT